MYRLATLTVPSDEKLSGNEARSCASLAQHKRFVEPSLISCFLTLCSLCGNKILAEGTHAMAEALQVNWSLEELK